MSLSQRKCFAVLFLAFLALSMVVTAGAYAETSMPSQTEWFKTFGIYPLEFVNSLIFTNDGGYAFAGLAGIPRSNSSNNESSSYFWLAKIDSNGNLQWNQVYSEVGNDAGANSVVQTASGGYTLAGTSISSNGTDQAVWLIHTDSNGNLQWNKTVDSGFTGNSVKSLIQTKDGNCLIAGSGSNGTVVDSGWLIKTDSNGNFLWRQTYPNIVPAALIQTSDGGFAIAGSSSVLIKTDSNGNLSWQQSFAQAGALGFTYCLVQTSDGGYAVAGGKLVPGVGGGLLPWLVKADGQGNLQWDQTFNGTAIANSVTELVQTMDGGYALGGYTFASGTSESFAFLFKADSSGSLEWIQTYAESLTTMENGLVQAGDGGFVLAGFLTSPNTSNLAWVIKTDGNGNAPSASVSASSVSNASSPSPSSILSSSPTSGSSSIPSSSQSSTPSSSTTPKSSIPEFPLWIAVPLIVAVTLAFVSFKKKSHNQSRNLLKHGSEVFN